MTHRTQFEGRKNLDTTVTSCEYFNIFTCNTGKLNDSDMDKIKIEQREIRVLVNIVSKEIWEKTDMN